MWSRQKMIVTLRRTNPQNRRLTLAGKDRMGTRTRIRRIKIRKKWIEEPYNWAANRKSEPKHDSRRDTGLQNKAELC